MKYSLLGLVVALSLVVSCGPQSGLPSQPSANPEESQQLPFDRQSAPADVSPSQSLVPAPAALPEGTAITIRLQNSVSSSTSHTGDTFGGTLDDPLIVEGQTVVERGAEVTGRVLAAKHSGRLHDPGYLRITLVSITVDGKPLAVETSSIFAKGGSHQRRNLAMIGGGTVAGALIGGLAGGGKGALIGSTVGAAGGAGTAYATGKKDVVFDSERRLTFRMAKAADLH